MSRLAILAISLGAWAAAAAEPPPSAGEEARLLEDARRFALDFTRTLPDFICTQFVRRSVQQANGQWKALDRLTVQLTFFGRKENARLLTVDGLPTDKTMDSLGGPVSEGEFGGSLWDVFHPQSATAFEWRSWSTLRKRRVAVYSYRILRAHSQYLLFFGPNARHAETVTVGYHGELCIDRDSDMVLRLTAETDDVPAGFPIREVLKKVEYDYASVSGRRYFLPVSAEISLQRGPVRTRNEVDFTRYRKFAAESTIDFDSPR
jgi:hypothetical protein